MGFNLIPASTKLYMKKDLKKILLKNFYEIAGDDYIKFMNEKGFDIHYYRVHFIGSGYESIKWIKITATNSLEATELALDWYKNTNQSFSYCELEAEEC